MDSVRLTLLESGLQPCDVPSRGAGGDAAHPGVPDLNQAAVRPQQLDLRRDVWRYGLAVDINPFENPEIQDGQADPQAAVAWADRSRSSPAMISEGDAAWRAFHAIGWAWGGDWHSLKDYMHFSANGL